ncbi:MAG: DUF5682 family protein [Prevotellaceae bacterium]|jgi:hypothetical protein|nr:DUF5682 family protein [Prevotellaceae bacterium]
MTARYNIFGIRHLSPGASFHLLKYLDECRPECILIEGPSDATAMIPDISRKGVEPPVALLAYTTELPIETVLYPFAKYSPEYQAILWGMKQKSEVRFIDLPAGVMLKIRQKKQTDTENTVADSFYRFHNGLYDGLAGQYGEDDYESYWERNFEHNLNRDSFRKGLSLQSAQIREMVIDREYEAAPHDFSFNHIREAFMRKEIQRAVSDGFKPEKTVIVAGAYHVSGILSELPPMSDDELKNIPRAAAQTTLTPYSYFRLSSRTGYGAGNKAPCYFELMWEAIQNNRLDELSSIYLSKIAHELREKGDNASTASIIEATRLANSLTSMKQGAFPVLRDLHDAAVTCFGGGDIAVIAEAINRVDVGTAIGRLPEGVSQTPVQEDMNQELKRLKLTAYRQTVSRELSLDLRENLKVKSREAAFIDLNRSTFLHRLKALNIHFAIQSHVSQDSATWAEKWTLRWTPEVEIEIVEASLKGETLEIAAACELREQLDECADISVAARIIRQACECNLVNIFDNALNTLQRLLVDSGNFQETAFAARELSILIQYGSLRQFNLEALIPVLQQLFLRSSLLLVNASSCDSKSAGNIVTAINTMELISQEQYETVDVKTWQSELSRLAWRDDLNTRLSGVAFSILLEHGIASEDDCAKEVSRRLSPGVPADLGAGWFEGLSGRNRYALLSRISLWKELDKYIGELDDDEFFRSVVFLRRALGDFEPNQKNSIAELLGDIWGTDAETVAEILQTELTEKETEKLDELNDFDFNF